MAIDGPIGQGEARSMDAVDDGVAREDHLGGRRQSLEDAELGRGQRDLLIIPARTPALSTQ
ncbi:hypothetical protein D3C87_2198190 [compost metagenome]